MNKLFNNILVPVDFSDASELAIEKAIDIANHFKCNIHLVFAHSNPGVKKTRHFVKGITARPIDAQARLYQLQNRFTYQLHPGLSFQSCFRKGNRSRGIVDYALTHHIDLVILGRATGMLRGLVNGRYNISEITNRIDCPVLTVRKDSAEDRWMNIVLPVCSMLPVRKMMFASYLAKKYNSRIHLLSIADDKNETTEDSNQYLSRAYQLLRDNTNLTIECHTIRGHNIANTTLRFAEKINADLIVVNSGSESRLPGFVNKLFNGSLFNESRIPVMAISTV